MTPEHIAAERCPQCGGPVPPGYGERVSCHFCGSSLVRLRPPAGAPDGGRGDETASSAWGVRLKRAVCMDPKFGVGVFQWLIPADWEFEGTVWWQPSVTAPAVVPFRAWNPAGPEQIECLPSIHNLWTVTPLKRLMGKRAPRQHVLPQDGLEQRAPMSAQEALVKLVIPRYRGRLMDPRPQPEEGASAPASNLEQLRAELGQLPGVDALRRMWSRAMEGAYRCPGLQLQLADREVIPDLGEMLQGRDGTTPDFRLTTGRDGARVRVRYTVEGLALEEDILCVVTKVETPLTFGFVDGARVYWCANCLYALRAAAGRLDSFATAAMASLRSVRLNPQWSQCCQVERQRILHERQAVTRNLQQMAANQMVAAQRQSQAGLADAARSMSEAGDILTDGWAAHSATMDRVGDAMSGAVRDIETFVEPSGDQVELPSGYEGAWTNGLGEYIVTDDVLFDPNADRDLSNQSWQTLRRRS